MPKGIPVGTLAIGASGAMNARLLAVAMLATRRCVAEEEIGSGAGKADESRR